VFGNLFFREKTGHIAIPPFNILIAFEACRNAKLFVSLRRNKLSKLDINFKRTQNRNLTSKIQACPWFSYFRFAQTIY